MANNSPVSCSWSFDFSAVAICYRGGFQEEVDYVDCKVEKQETAKDVLTARILEKGYRIVSCKEMVCQTKDGRLGTFLFVVDAPPKKKELTPIGNGGDDSKQVTRALEAKLVGGEWR